MAKRKAAELAHSDPYDSDEIQVAPTRPSRRALQDVPIREAQNKRRRIADCVLIPVNRETKKLMQLAECFQPGPRRQISSFSRSPSDDGELKLSYARSVSPAPMQDRQPVQASQSLTPPPADDQRDTMAVASPVVDGKSGRPRRSRVRMSYALEIDDLDDSAHELTLDGPAFRRAPANRKKKAASVLLDYEDGSSVDAEDVGEEYEDQDDSSASEESDDPSETDGEVPTRARKRRVPLKAHTATSDAAQSTVKSSKKMSKAMENLTGSGKGLDLSLPPMHEVDDIFSDLTKRALTLGLENAVKSLSGRRIRVATMCSGTESPLLAIQMIQDALRLSLGNSFEIEHLFSAEITPFKQAYIERNFNPPVIFQDIRELVQVVGDDIPMATTAYGGKALVPTKLDVVIAGTSCVDFSQMNNHQKDIIEVGESSDTWNAVLSYCKAFRPAIVILENVKSAAWDAMLQDYRDAGYQPAGAYVDSKNYYVPQTRQRGYMVCFDKDRLQMAGLDESVSKSWTSLMEKLQRPASSPVSSFLLPTDRIATRPLQVNENSQERDWAKCETRQISYRLSKRLGVNRPITHWLENGTVSAPDYGSRHWHAAQVERVLDTLEVATLMKAREGYDPRFKTRIWDVSQNSDRIYHNAHFGIIGCITPTGINFVSDAWRPMAAEECLVLQGLPLNKISFTVETYNEIQSLAGNAMSAPIVGAAFLSSLIAGHKMFDSAETSAPTLSLVQVAPELANTKMEQVSIDCDEQHLDVPSLLLAVERALRRCYCEGAAGTTQRGIQQCADCGHTTCIVCGGNPEHRYHEIKQLSAGRTSMAVFEAEIRSRLPLKLKLTNMPNWPANTAPTNFFDRVRPIDLAVFSLTTIRRSHCVTIAYTAPEGHLKLHLEEGRASWYLFANAPSDLAAHSALRQSLSQPVAMANVDQSLLAAPWSWRKPTQSVTSITVSGYGQQLPTCQARMQMPEFKDDWQWQYLSIEATSCDLDIGGIYQYLPRCGTANESLYKRTEAAAAGRAVYLFLDPTRVGAAKDDCFVFAYDHSRLEYDEVRSVIAKMDPAWRPWDQAHGKSSINVQYFDWSPSESSLEPISPKLSLHQPKSLATINGSSCRQGTIVMSADVDIESIVQHHPSHGGFVQLDDHRFFTAAAWIFEAMRRHLPMNDWTQLQNGLTNACTDCAPAKPALRWQLSSSSSQISSYEDPYTAAMYERAIKHRQPPILVCATSSSVKLGINLISLAHRAQAKLASVDNQVTLHWRLATSQTTDELAAKQFHLQPTRDVQPSEEDVHMSVTLSPKQRMSLSWMRAQEAGLGRQITLEEVEEATLPYLGWRVEMRAQATAYVKGGICADHPGFGKTITSLALIHTEWLQEGPRALKAQVTASAQRALQLGFLPSTATVIICPKILVEQWYGEACEKWGSEEDVYKIDDAGDLKNFTIENFASAKLIIVSRQALASAAYTERLAALAAVPGPSTEKGRAHAVWMKHATAQIPEHLAILKRSGRTALVEHLQSTYKRNLRSEEYQAHVPSKRFTGQEYIQARGKTQAAALIGKETSKVKAASATLATRLVGPPMFEMFFFNRVVVDEFHEYNPREFEAIIAMKADKRWGLSGTPALGDCYEVAQIGRLLGVSLRMGSMQRGFMKQHNIKTLQRQMTRFEKFEAARTAPSHFQNSRVREQAQQFLDLVARQNVSDLGEMSLQQHLVPVNLSIDHQATYHELSQHLNSSDMKIRKSIKTNKTDRQKQFDAAVKNADTAEEVLSKAAAYPCQIGVGEAPRGNSSMASWLKKREDEAASLIKDLGPAIRAACKEEPEEYFSWREARIDANELKDEETAAIVKDLCKKADGGKTLASIAASSKKRKGASSGRDSTSIANKLATRRVTSKRSTRYLKNVQRLQALTLSSKDKPKKCDDPECRSSLKAAEKIAVSGLCGHLICNDCLQRTHARNLTKCCADGCGENLAAYHLLWNYKLGDIRNTAKHPPHGAKIEAALNILETIRSKSEQAVLFVQYDSQLAEMKHALAKRGVQGIVVSATKDGEAAGKKIAEFQKKGSKQTVIVLNSSAETAAGLNLQCASNVIFLSPLLKDTQYQYDSTMAQAIGRVRRYGQKKEIHVYRILALNTIDVDILEHRERRIDALTEQGAPAVVPPPAAKMLDVHADGAQAERTQLVREKGRFSLRPQSWLVKCDAESEDEEEDAGDVWRKVKGRKRVMGWEDFSSLVKFSRGFVEDDD